MGVVNQRQIVVAHAGRVRAVGPGFQFTDLFEAQDLGPEHVRFIHVADIEHDMVQPHGRDDRKRLSGPGNQLWHSDSSYQKIPARYSLLNAHVLRPGGGGTQFADMRAVYDKLDVELKTRIEGLICEHSHIFSTGALGISLAEAELQVFAPVRQGVVRTPRKTGRKSLFLSSHAGRIVELPASEARLLLRKRT